MAVTENPMTDLYRPGDLSYDDTSTCPAGCVSPDEQLIRSLTSRVLAALQDRLGPESPMLAPVGISARHCHVTDEALEVLYGPGARLRPYRDLRQPGFHAAVETVTVIGPRMRAIENVRILGPTRNYNQVELSRTDGYMIGLSLPVRDSGQLEGTPGVTLVGPAGSLTLDKGAIRAGRHIHIAPEAAEAWGLKEQQLVSAEFEGEKGVLFRNVLVRIGEGLVAEMHLDTDDGNAADLTSGDMMRIIP
jgi:putative phosphotransacetylase